MIRISSSLTGRSLIAILLRQSLSTLRLRLADQILDELPGDAAGAVTSGHRPFDRPRMQLLARQGEVEMIGIEVDHAEEGVLVAGMEAQPQAEAVAERDFLVDRVAGIDRRRALIVDEFARQQMAPVGGR